ncbi:MAG: TIGR00341 family protein [Methyloprofundus sp.]|nr:TIGR00341 family protein [Methyloprofundus sp.]
MSGPTVYFIYSSSVGHELDQVLQHELIIKQGIQLRKIKLADFKSLHCAKTISHALVWVEENDLAQVLSLAVSKNLSLGVLPVQNQEASVFYKSLGLNLKFDDCLEIALQDDPLCIDLITCNDIIVTSGIHMMNQTMMAEFINNPSDANLWHRSQFHIKRFFHAFTLKPYSVTLTTAKGKVISTAITGLALLDFEKFMPMANLFGPSVSLRDQHLSVALLSPQSILGYLRMTSSPFIKNGKKIPANLGYIRSVSLLISSPVELQYYVNNQKLISKVLEIKVLAQGVKINVGERLREAQYLSDDKESVSCEQLPHSEAKIKYLQQSLPFFPHAQESDFKDLFLALKENAKTTSTFLLLMVLSAMLATLGLFLNSPAVVIGAMVLAPLMSPIISLSMGLQRSDIKLSRRAFTTLLVGTFIALALSATMACLFPVHIVTNEIQGRLNPSILDLLVAVLSGVAGAFAHSRENIAKSLPGVAIAVALVPPLCVAGIGLGWMNQEIFLGAMLLYITNLAGIILAAGLSFMVIGFAPFSRAKKGILLSFFFVSIISVPLVISFQNMQKIEDIRHLVVNENYLAAGEKVKLRRVKVHLGKPMIITADLLIRGMPSAVIISDLERQLKDKLQQPLHFDFSIHLVDEVFSDKK